MLCKRICQDLFEKRPNKGVTTSQLHGAYARSMGLKGGEGLPFPEFAEMIQNLSSFGFTKLEGKTQDIGKKTIGIPVA